MVLVAVEAMERALHASVGERRATIPNTFRVRRGEGTMEVASRRMSMRC